RAEIRDQGFTGDAIAATARLHLRYEGTDTPLTVGYADAAAMAGAFEAEHRARYGFAQPGKALIVEAISVEAVARFEDAEPAPPPAPADLADPAPVATVPVHMAGAERPVPVFSREALR